MRTNYPAHTHTWCVECMRARLVRPILGDPYVADGDCIDNDIQYSQRRMDKDSFAPDSEQSRWMGTLTARTG